MGWLYSQQWDTKESLVQHLLNGLPWYNVIAHSVNGNNLWMVCEKKPDAPEGAENRWLGLVMMQSGRGDGWGYKDMSESAGPYESNCPLKYLDMVPDPGGYATEFRARVRAYHAERGKLAKQRRGLAIGQTVKIKPGVRWRNGAEIAEMRIARLKPLTGEHEGGYYRLTPRLIEA